MNELAIAQPQSVFVDAVIAKIKRPTPANQIKSREVAGRKFSYVDTAYIVEQLNDIFGHAWSFESELITPWELIAKSRQVVVKCRIKVGGIVKEQYGESDIKFHKLPDGSGPDLGRPLSIGNDIKGATSDGMKKCASLLGVAADVYSGEATDTGASKSSSNGKAMPAGEKKNFTPKDPTALRTQKQIDLILNKAKRAGIETGELDAWAIENLGMGLDELTMGSVNGVIEYLNEREAARQ